VSGAAALQLNTVTQVPLCKVQLYTAMAVLVDYGCARAAGRHDAAAVSAQMLLCSCFAAEHNDKSATVQSAAAHSNGCVG
jgi:hypothetical protein